MKNTDIQPYNDNFSKQEFLKEEAYYRAKEKVKKIIGFYWHLAVYIVINVLIILVIVLNGGPLWHFGTLSTPITIFFKENPRPPKPQTSQRECGYGRCAQLRL